MRDDSQTTMGIAELAARAGVTPRTIRYYVAEGLLPAPGGRGQRRAYTEQHLERLDAIRALKSAYLPLHEIRRRLDAPASPPGPGDCPAPPAPLRGANIGCADIISRARERGSQLVARGISPGTGAVGGMVANAGALVVGAVATEGRLPFGLGERLQVGRVEIYDPTETVWHRVSIAPDVEIHYRQTDDPALNEAIQRLLREAAAILEAPTHAGGKGQATEHDPTGQA